MLRIIAGLFLLGCALVTGAQAIPAGVGPGKYVRVGVGYSDYHIEYGQRYLQGWNGWVDANPTWRWGAEFEARRLRKNTDLNVYTDTYLMGPRVTLLSGAIAPYVKGLVGVAKFNFPYNYARGSYGVYGAGAGLDLHVADRVHIRVVDVEWQKWPQFTFGEMKSYGISAGVSFTFYRGTSWRVQ